MEGNEVINKIQNSIMNSLAIIYQKTEKIEMVDKDKANEIIKTVEKIRMGIESNQTQTIEFLSDIMTIQTDIINYLDSEIYKKNNTETQKNQIERELAAIGNKPISEEDKAALLQCR